MKSFLTVCLNPTIQKTIVLDSVSSGKVNRYSEYYTTASGKGINVSRVLSQLDKKVTHLTHYGGNMGRFFLKLAERDKLKISSIQCESETRICTTLIEKDTGNTTELVEEPSPVETSADTKIRALFLKEIKKAHTLIISGSRTPGYSEDLYPWMVQTAKAENCFVILDYRGADLISSLEFRPDVIKPNLDELKQTLEQFPDHDMGSLEETILQIADITVPVITDSCKEIVYSADGEIRRVKPGKIKAVNTTGCGDSFAAGLASALYDGKDIHESIQEGIRCAALNAKSILPGNIFL